MAQWTRAAEVLLDASGNGRVEIQADPGETITITAATVTTVAQDPPFPEFRLYRGIAATPQAEITTSTKGHNDQASGSGEQFKPGEILLGVWTGGTAGTRARLEVAGSIGIDIAP